MGIDAAGTPGTGERSANCEPRSVDDWPRLLLIDEGDTQLSVTMDIAARQIRDDVMAELGQAVDRWPPFNSAHEGYGVLAEEFDELWAHVKTNQKRRDIQAMRKEAIQVAAMAMRFALEVCDETNGRK